MTEVECHQSTREGQSWTRLLPLVWIWQDCGSRCVHRLRQGLVEERTALINRMRGLLTEFGVVAPLSPQKLRCELRHCLDEDKTAPQEFRNGRQFAAWLGLVPRQHSTGGKTRLGR